MELELFKNDYREREILTEFKPGDLISIKNYSSSLKDIEVDVFELEEINLAYSKRLNWFSSINGTVKYCSSLKKASKRDKSSIYKKSWIKWAHENNYRVFIRNANLSEKFLYTINLLWKKK